VNVHSPRLLMSIDGNGAGDACELPPAGQPTGVCGCGNGMDGMMIMPMTLLSIAWMRRRR
ncbi:MAG: MYXO-CTERM sorting domain-containing protein, partial [Phycisphaerae bacterium]